MIYITTECDCGELVREGEEHACPTLNDVMDAAEANEAPDEHELAENARVAAEWDGVNGDGLEPRTEPDNRRPTEPPQMSDAEFEACLQPVRMLSPEQARQMRAAVLNALGPTIMPSELLREKYDGPDSRLGGAAAYEIKLLAKALGEVLDEVLK